MVLIFDDTPFEPHTFLKSDIYNKQYVQGGDTLQILISGTLFLGLYIAASNIA